MFEEEDKLDYLRKNMKIFRKFGEELHDIHILIQLIIKIFAKKVVKQNESRVKLVKKGSRKQVGISDKEFYEPFCE